MEPLALRHLHDRAHAFRRVALQCAGLDWTRRRAHPVALSIFGLELRRSSRLPAHLRRLPHSPRR
jgi:hypothetical protein